MTENQARRAADVARAYYDTGDVDGFYAHAWGGEDIHVGLYEHEREAVGAASGRTVDHLAAKAADVLGPGSTVLDLGSGYGGAARRLAGRFGCRVVALNISEVQNRRHRELNAERGLDHLIEVVTGSFNEIPSPGARFDVVWSQEALCHSGDRALTLREAARVLRPGGRLLFTDIMAAEDAPAAELRPLEERLTVADLATPAFYHGLLPGLGLTDVEFDDLSEHMLTHYLRLEEEVGRDGPGLAGAVSDGYRARLRENLPLWSAACRKGHLRWGTFAARRA
ncbi:methyltransferase domain-containing protein [Streptomyces sp. NPDC049577]|uniref:SAM-dependent methyltransferase n=1 Tax=Streptomyces sp. NPDC049577 TaxID=3155153 RepID=UPI003412430A